MAPAQISMQELETLSLERDSEKRRELLRKITDLFFVTQEQQSDSDRNVFGNVMGRIAYELENDARAELSERLSSVNFAPHNVVRRLAEDEISVARPVLEHSVVLSDNDLADIAAVHSQDHLMAMSKRQKLSSLVTDVIVERGNDHVLTSVAKNRGAEFSSKSFETLSLKATSHAELRSHLIDRDDIPNEVIETIKRSVAAKLKSEFDSQYSGISSLEIDQVVETQAEHVDFSPLAKNNRYGPLEIDVQAMYDNDVLTEAYLRDFAEKGKKAELVHALALLTHIDTNMAHHTLYEAEVPALAVLCAMIGSWVSGMIVPV